MTLSIRLNRYLPLLPLIIPILCILVSQSYLFDEDPVSLSAAITFDLLITTPVIYFLIIRKRSIPNTTVVPVFILGIIIGSIIIPEGYQDYLSIVKTWFLPILEITIVTYVILKIRKAFSQIKKHQTTSIDFFGAAKEASVSILPKALVIPFATELSVFYYGLLAWKSKKHHSNEFTYHKSTSTILVLAVFVFLIIIEAVAIHLLVQGWSTIAAWIFTGLSAYGCFQVLGILKSIPRRPIRIEDDHLILKWGIMVDTQIALSSIKEVKGFTKSVEKGDGYKFLSPFHEMEGHNVLLEFSEPSILVGFYGFKKSFDRLLLQVDNPDQFIEKIQDSTSIH